MNRKISTKVVIDSETLELLARDSYDYDGPVDLAAYDQEHAIIGTFTLAAQNLVAGSSGAIVAGGTTLTNIPTGDSTAVIGIGAVITATPSAPPAGVKPFVVIGTVTSTGQSSFAQSSGSSGYSAFVPPANIGTGGNIATVGLVATGTAAATETIGATTLVISVGPQFT